MLTKISINNFKTIENAEIELGQNVVFIGPNNSGKTSALQAIALWDTGLKIWLSSKGHDVKVSKRAGVTINKRDLIALSVPDAKLLWKDLHVWDASEEDKIMIQIIAEGINNGEVWRSGFEFYFANPESFYCRPILKNEKDEMIKIPTALADVKVAFLPPMSGLASVEPKIEHGRINVLIGEGQTAQVLRNLCHDVYNANGKTWKMIVDHISSLFGVKLEIPEYIGLRGEITLKYKDQRKNELDISCSGRGLQQTLLLLSYLYSNPGTVVLLDEPDAHLEILRQRHIYRLITEVATEQRCQIIAASHSEVVLNEAVEKDTVIAFVGRPHKINNKGQQVIKSLKEIGFQDYYLAEEKGWVLYMEGTTDLMVLRAMAKKLKHPAEQVIEMPFLHVLGNNVPKNSYNHFFALKEACPDLLGLAIYDKIGFTLEQKEGLTQMMWSKREIENYICNKDVLIEYARGKYEDDIFLHSQSEHRAHIMAETIKEFEDAIQLTKNQSPWDDDFKISDDFLDPLFSKYHEKLGLPANTLRKNAYFELVELLPKEKIHSDIIGTLNLIVEISEKANPSI